MIDRVQNCWLATSMCYWLLILPHPPCQRPLVSAEDREEIGWMGDLTVRAS